MLMDFYIVIQAPGMTMDYYIVIQAPGMMTGQILYSNTGPRYVDGFLHSNPGPRYSEKQYGSKCLHRLELEVLSTDLCFPESRLYEYMVILLILQSEPCMSIGYYLSSC